MPSNVSIELVPGEFPKFLACDIPRAQATCNCGRDHAASSIVNVDGLVKLHLHDTTAIHVTPGRVGMAGRPARNAQARD
jgi:hypothetical protein